MPTLAITDAITTLAEVERRFGLVRSEAGDFFSEWQRELPVLIESENIQLQELRRRYLYYRSEGKLFEGTVTLLMVSPLLTVDGNS